MKPPYRDRAHAGSVLAGHLGPRVGHESTILAVPNGGVAVAVPLASRLKLPLDLIIVRKIPIPGNPEAGLGSVASDGSLFFNRDIVWDLGLSEEEVEALARPVVEEIGHRMKIYGASGKYESVRGGTAVLVDDGLASGVTMEAAVHVVRAYEPRSVLVAVPTASLGAVRRLQPLVTEVICPDVRSGSFFAVADAYEEWGDLESEEVISLLKRPF